MEVLDIQNVELFNFAAVLLGAGLFAGLLAGLLGVGGGAISVPVLFYVFTFLGLDEATNMHLAVGTSLAIIIPTSLSSLRAHHKRGAVDMDLLWAWAPAIVVGVALGSVLAGVSNSTLLIAIFASVALIMSINMVFGRQDWRLGEHMITGVKAHSVAGVMGGLSAMMGIGGGAFGVTVMTLYGYSIHRAVGTAAGFGAMISIPGTIGFIIAGWDVPGRPPFSLGYVNLIGFVLLALAAAVAAPVGAWLAHSTSRVTLMRAFALFLFLTSLRMFWTLFSG